MPYSPESAEQLRRLFRNDHHTIVGISQDARFPRVITPISGLQGEIAGIVETIATPRIPKDSAQELYPPHPEFTLGVRRDPEGNVVDYRLVLTPGIDEDILNRYKKGMANLDPATRRKMATAIQTSLPACIITPGKGLIFTLGQEKETVFRIEPGKRPAPVHNMFSDFPQAEQWLKVNRHVKCRHNPYASPRRFEVGLPTSLTTSRYSPIFFSPRINVVAGIHYNTDDFYGIHSQIFPTIMLVLEKGLNPLTADEIIRKTVDVYLRLDNSKSS